jgi:hypothetical protein
MMILTSTLFFDKKKTCKITLLIIRARPQEGEWFYLFIYYFFFMLIISLLRISLQLYPLSQATNPNECRR